MSRTAVAQYSVTPVDTKWVDTDKAFEDEPMQIRSRIVAREFGSGDRPDLYAGTLPLEALKAIISVAASHSPKILTDACRCFPCMLPCQGSEPVLVNFPAEDCSGKDIVKIGLLKKSMYGTSDAASSWESAWQGHLES